MRRKIKILSLVAVFMSLLGFWSSAHAVLSSVGPVNPSNGYPVFYGDFVGRNLDLCLVQTLSPNVAPVPGDPSATYMCVLLAPPGAPFPGSFNPNAPVVFPTNFPDESFYWTGDPDLTNIPSVKAAVFALEAAFASGDVQDGQQIVFARIRFRVDAPVAGTYRITHPFGVHTFPNVAVGIGTINFTDDVGIGGLGFTGALNGAIGPFLVWDTGPITVGTEQFVGDPNIAHAVTGSPFGTNFFRVEVDTNGDGTFETNLGETTLFFISGKISSGVIPSPLVVDRAGYTRAASGAGYIDVFATSTGLSSLQVSGTGITTTAMSGDPLTGKFHGHIPFPAGTTLPASITVTNLSDNPVTTVLKGLTDEVFITTADFDMNSRTLALVARSSDALPPLPALSSPTVNQTLTSAPPNWTLNFSPLFVPPLTVSVQSSKGGIGRAPVAVVNTSVGTPPTAVNDVATIPESTALVPSSLLNFNIIANDTPSVPAQVVVTLLNGPAHGTAVNNGNGTITYTPTVNFNGTDSFAYVIREVATGLYSNPALVTITVTAVNSLPVAVNDSATTVAGSPVLINVLANDFDPDGTLNPASVTIVPGLGPANGTVVVNTASGAVTYTPNAGFTGTNTFTYTVRDNLGALSNQAVVTVTVTPVVTATESLTVLKAQFRTPTYEISGTSTIAGATVTIRIGPNLSGAVIATAVVAADGKWSFRGTSATVPNPGIFRSISVQSTGGGSLLNFPLLVR